MAKGSYRRRINLNWGWAEAEDVRDTVEVGDHLLPRTIRLTLPGADDQPQLEMVLDSSSGVCRCRELHVIATEAGAEVRTADTKRIKVEDWIEGVAPLFMDQITERGKGGAVTAVQHMPDSDAQYVRAARTTLKAARRSSHRKMTPELLRRVANVYAQGQPRPAEAVERAFGVAPRTAYRYIRLAREGGYLTKDGD